MKVSEDVLEIFNALGFANPVPQILLDIYAEVKYTNDLMRPNKLSPEMIALMVVLYRRGMLGKDVVTVVAEEKAVEKDEVKEEEDVVNVMFLGKKVQGKLVSESGAEVFILLNGETEPRKFPKSVIIKD